MGNPDAKYQNTPHNIGYYYVESFSETGKGKIEHKAVTKKITLEGESLMLAKPTTYVNLSGESARALLSYYKLTPSSLIVITDDANLETGAIRIRTKGSHGGHKGLANIIHHCGETFVRIRIGIGRCPENMDLSSFVLKKWNQSEIKIFSEMKATIHELVKFGLTDGWETTATRFNRKSL